MLDIVQRYAPIVKAVKNEKLKVKKIVEVGGTGEGISFYLPDYKIYDCDIEFVKNILPNVKAIYCKRNKIPLPDNFANIVCSVDMLEHLPTKRVQQKMIKEMARVAKRKVFLAIPTGDESLTAIKLFGKMFYKKYPGKINKYVEEHKKYGHPEANEIIEMINKSGYKSIIKTEKNANIKLWLFFQNIYLKFPKLYLIFRYRKLWYHILTPILPFCNSGKTLRTIFYIKLEKN